MRKYPTILVIAIALTSCGLVSKYSSSQHAQYAKMLTPADKALIIQEGEITKDIEFHDPKNHDMLKGTLRILKTERPDVFNFVEVGEWINHSRLGNSGKDHNLEFRDTINYDQWGNSLFRAVYYKDKNGGYTLGEKWTSKNEGNLFTQHITIYRGEILATEMNLRIIDPDKPKSDLQKRKIKTGVYNDYYPDGKLMSSKTYDESGKIIKEEKFMR